MSATIETRAIDAVLRQAKHLGFMPRSVLTVARYRFNRAEGRKVRRPTGLVSRLYLDALDGREKGLEASLNLATATLQRLIERLETLWCQQTLPVSEISAAEATSVPKWEEKRVVIGGAVRVYGCLYSAAPLFPLNGRTVSVILDVADTSRVVVMDHGYRVCEAALLAARTGR